MEDLKMRKVIKTNEVSKDAKNNLKLRAIFALIMLATISLTHFLIPVLHLL